MIAAIIIIGLALAWLTHETAWFTIRLLVGPEFTYNRKPWADLKPWKITTKDPFWLRHPDSMTPLCGTDWLENRLHVIPEYKFELNTYGVRYKMTIKEAGIMTQVMKANKLTKAQRLSYA